MPALGQVDRGREVVVARWPRASSSPNARVSSARARGPRGARLTTGTIRPAGTPWARRSPATREQAVQAVEPGAPTTSDEVCGHGGARAMVLRSSMSSEPHSALALEVVIDVGHDHAGTRVAARRAPTSKARGLIEVQSRCRRRPSSRW